MFEIEKKPEQLKVSFQFEAHEVQQLDRLAGLVGGTRSDVIRHLLLEGLDRHMNQPFVPACTCNNCPHHR